MLADGITRLDIEQGIKLNIELVNPTPVDPEHSCVTLDFHVIESPHDAIVGMHTLLGPMYPYFTQVLDKHHVDQLRSAASGLFDQAQLHATLDEQAHCLTQNPNMHENSVSHRNTTVCNVICALAGATRSSAYPHELREPFSTVPEEAEEEIHGSPVVNFGFQQHFASITKQEAHDEYVAMFDEHIHTSFLNHSFIHNTCEATTRQLMLDYEDVFVPENWLGIKCEPIHIPFKSEPPIPKMKARHVNQILFAPTKIELSRLVEIGMYIESVRPRVHGIVVAPKKTDPYIRICGDYTPINGYIENLRYPIPNVLNELTKIQKYSIFADMDMTNAFHQFPLDVESSEMLSIITPWGQYRPVFMPEGIGPASVILQKHVREMFAEFDEWTVVIFDNILILANDMDDLYFKLQKFLNKCREYNVVLKMAKSFIGYTEATFFGYLVQHGKYTVAAKLLGKFHSQRTQLK